MTRILKVDYLARVEGEGGLIIKLRGDEVVDVQLKIFEPPRFFEALLQGRNYTEPPDITARICGICPVAYQMSSVQALEQALGIEVPAGIHALRRLLYCGEWIESHVLHIAMLHAPDFLGYADVIEMARDHPALVRSALELKRAGNEIVRVLGGREIHPINVKVGGFYRLPTAQELSQLAETLHEALPRAEALLELVLGFPFPDFERDYEFVALVHPTEYPMATGRLASSRGLDAPVEAWPEHFEEFQVRHSNALQCRLKGRGAYLVGPLARYALNYERLPQRLRDTGLGPVCRNPFRSIIVRALEVLLALEEALRLCQPVEAAPVTIRPRAGVGHGASEAPRGLLYHRYELDEQGMILSANIVPPTSQNQTAMEEDLRHFLPPRVSSPDAELVYACEHAVRNYDPCISCATHFLKVKLEQV